MNTTLTNLNSAIDSFLLLLSELTAELLSIDKILNSNGSFDLYDMNLSAELIENTINNDNDFPQFANNLLQLQEVPNIDLGVINPNEFEWPLVEIQTPDVSDLKDSSKGTPRTEGKSSFNQPGINEAVDYSRISKMIDNGFFDQNSQLDERIRTLKLSDEDIGAAAQRYENTRLNHTRNCFPTD